MEVMEDDSINIWQPEYIIDLGMGCKIGVTVDDGCFVVLYPTGVDQWQPGTHIPKEVAKFIGQMYY